MRIRASKVRPGMTVQAGTREILITEARDVGGMACFNGTATGSSVAFTAHPSDLITLTCPFGCVRGWRSAVDTCACNPAARPDASLSLNLPRISGAE